MTYTNKDLLDVRETIFTEITAQRQNYFSSGGNHTPIPPDDVFQFDNLNDYIQAGFGGLMKCEDLLDERPEDLYGELSMLAVLVVEALEFIRLVKPEYMEDR